MKKNKLFTYPTGVETLKDILQMSQPELHGYLYSFLRGQYGKKEVGVRHGSYIYAKGDIPVIVLAHLDTVHSSLPIDSTLFYDSDKEVMWSPDGIGADCRAGVFNVVNLIERGYRPHVLFTWNEEIGGVGAGEFVKFFPNDYPEFHAKLEKDVNFAVQFDRHGFSEAVYYDLDSQEFENYISSFGYKTEIGSFTDICEVCPAYGFAGVNVAAGYTDEHTKHEILWIEEMHQSYLKVMNMLEDQLENPKYFEYIDGYGGYGFDALDKFYHGSGFSYSSSKSYKKEEYCADCFLPKDQVLWTDSNSESCNLCSGHSTPVSTSSRIKERVCDVCLDEITPEARAKGDYFVSADNRAFCSRECFDLKDEM